MWRWPVLGLALLGPCVYGRRYTQAGGCRELDITATEKAFLEVLTDFDHRHQKLLKKKNITTDAADAGDLQIQAGVLANHLRFVACLAATKVAEYQDKISWKLRYLHWIARSDADLPLQWPSQPWMQIFESGDGKDQRKAAKVLKYVHLSLVHTYKVRQEAMAALQKASVFPEGKVDVATDDLFVVTSAGYGLLHKAIMQAGRKGGVCEVLERGDGFGDAFSRFTTKVDISPSAEFFPSPLDLVSGETAYQVVRGEKPLPPDCSHANEPHCQQATQMFCPYCLNSFHLEGEYWFPVDMMAATVMNALSDVLDAKRQLEKGSLSEKCQKFFAPKFAR